MRGRVLLSLLLTSGILLAGCTQMIEEAREDPVDDELPPVDDAPVFPPDATPATPTPADTPPVEPTPPADPAPATPTPPAEPAPPPVEPTPVAPPPPGPTPPAPSPPTPTPPPPAPSTPPPPTPTPPTPTPTPPPPATWPREGSHVSYEARASRTSYDGEYSQEDRSTITWTFTGGDWRGACTNHQDEYVNGRWENGTSTRTLTAATPPHWPPMNTRSPPAEGQSMTVWFIDACSPARWDAPFAGARTETTTVNGRSVTVSSYAADLSAENQAFSTEWSRSHGLVLEWSHWRAGGAMSSSFEGRLVNTDAPMT